MHNELEDDHDPTVHVDGKVAADDGDKDKADIAVKDELDHKVHVDANAKGSARTSPGPIKTIIISFSCSGYACF